MIAIRKYCLEVAKLFTHAIIMKCFYDISYKNLWLRGKKINVIHEQLLMSRLQNAIKFIHLLCLKLCSIDNMPMVQKCASILDYCKQVSPCASYDAKVANCLSQLMRTLKTNFNR